MIGKIFKRHGSTVIVACKNFPSFATVNRFFNRQSLQDGILVYAVRYVDNKAFCVLIFFACNFWLVKRDKEYKFFRLPCVVYRLHDVFATFVQGKGIFAIAVTQKFAVFVKYAEHCHFIQLIKNRNGYNVAEIIFAVKYDRVLTTFTQRIFDCRSFAHDDKRINALVSVCVGNNKFVYAFGFKYKSVNGFAVHREIYAFYKRNVVRKNGFCVRKTEKIFICAIGCRGFLPVVETFDSNRCVFGNYFVKAFFGKVRNFRFCVARFLVYKIRSVDCVYCVFFIHRQACIPSLVIPSAGTNEAFFTQTCKRKCVIVIFKGIEITVCIVYFPKFLLQRFCCDIDCGRREGILPNVPRRIGAYYFVNARIYRVHNRAFCVRNTVDRYARNGCGRISVAVRPSNRNVSVRYAVNNVIEGQGFIFTVDND